MSEAGRVRRWRAQQKAEGRQAVTVWLSTTQKRSLEDTARTLRLSPSELVSQALVAFQPGGPPMMVRGADPAQLRALIREELVRLGHEYGGTETGRKNVTDIVTDTITDTEKPGLETPVSVLDFDPQKFVLGGACKYGHCSHGAAGNLRELVFRKCVRCEAEKKAARKTPTQPALVIHSGREIATETPGDVAETAAYDATKYVLGKLCPRGHAYQHTGKSLLQQSNHKCLVCHREQGRAYRAAKRHAATA